MQPFYVAFDAALAALSVRSIVVLRGRAPWTSSGWGCTVGYCVAAISEFGAGVPHRQAALVSFGFLIALTVAFVVAGVRDEPQAEPLLWPTHAGKTRAEKRQKG